jgi:hypothetical protein
MADQKQLSINGRTYPVDAPEDVPLLLVLRDAGSERNDAICVCSLVIVATRGVL